MSAIAGFKGFSDMNPTVLKPFLLVAACSICLAGGTGCSSINVKPQSTGTGVNLSGNNYKLIKPGVSGQSFGFSLLGIIPVWPPSPAVAKRELYRSVGQPLAGRAVALANVSEDRTSWYLVAFSVPRISITADVIEFTDRPSGSSKVDLLAPGY